MSDHGAAGRRTGPSPRIPRGEAGRKALHVAVGMGALLLPWLGRWQAFVICLAAVGMNALILPRLTRHAMEREEDRRRGWAAGIVLYPASIALLLLFFGARLDVVAAAWGILAFGDGLATLAGLAIGGPRLAWNPRKSWSGFAAFVTAGTAASFLLATWLLDHARPVEAPSSLFLLIACATASCVAALVESYPSGIDDNITVPIAAGVCLYGLSFVDPAALGAGGGALVRGAAIACAVNAPIAAAAWAARTVSVSGAVAGFVTGASCWTFGGWRAWVVLVAFFILGSGATRLGYAHKAARGLAQEAGGRRGARHAIANCSVPVFLAFLAAATPYPGLMSLALVAALATAAFDTVSSECGQRWGKRAFLITTLRRVAPGTEGAVSIEGTLAGATAAVLMALIALACGLVTGPGAAIAVVAAAIGATLESYVGAWSRPDPGARGAVEGPDNEAMNLLNTLTGAAAAILLALRIGG